MKLQKELKNKNEKLEYKEDEVIEFERVKTQYARKYIDQLRRFLMQEANEVCPMIIFDYAIR